MAEVTSLTHSMGWVFWQLVFGLSVYFGLLLLEKIMEFGKKVKNFF